ncbi:MAG TPA: hypothetical protein VFL55_15680 [Acetobacteraceae bacterium]|nr:hypothetical protein [Acetobacteraceae bacterium]
MKHLLVLLPLTLLIGCADPSRGAALNECRLKYWLDDPNTQARLTTECMQAKSFVALTPCDPVTDPYEWDERVDAFAFDNPRCYHPIGTQPWLATALSPM